MTKRLLMILLALVLGACSSGQAGLTVEDLPPGDAERGATLFTQSINGAPACSTCHHATEESPLVGPGLAGYAQRAATRVEGQSAEQYTLESIIVPSRYIVSRFSNAMYNRYAEQLSAQQIADLMAYLLTL